MRAWAVDRPGPIDGHPLAQVERAVPEPGARQIRVRVDACGVCRTDLHLAEGDLAPKRHLVVPGHEVVGVVDAVGMDAARFAPGDRVGVPWLAHTCGICRYCRRGDENLCALPEFTGWDREGGYADYAIATEDYAYPIPPTLTAEQAAPLLCAGIIGYRALRQARLPEGGRLGIYGFGASAHLTAQVAIAAGARVHVVTRAPSARQLALELGAISAGDGTEGVPEPLDAAILFAPVGTLVPDALAALDRGGTVVIAGIHLTDIPSLNYQRHLFEERTLRSVTANTRQDGNDFLALAARIPLRIHTVAYPLDQANRALQDLAADRITGAAVLVTT
jgi:propanol-preferring alcohol dehydrogenase